MTPGGNPRKRSLRSEPKAISRQGAQRTETRSSKNNSERQRSEVNDLFLWSKIKTEAQGRKVLQYMLCSDIVCRLGFPPQQIFREKRKSFVNPLIFTQNKALRAFRPLGKNYIIQDYYPTRKNCRGGNPGTYSYFKFSQKSNGFDCPSHPDPQETLGQNTRALA